jgi:RND family efflux transporter MFP subunit
VLVLTGRLIAANVRFHRQLRRHSRPVGGEVAELLDRCRAEMGIRRLVTALATPTIRIPALFGLLRPRLLLPEGLAEALSGQELRHVLRHELAHLRRWDVALDWVATGLALLHWFNPLIWVALWRMRSDRELACDEAVLARTGGRGAREYGRTILKLLEGLPRPTRLAGVVGVVERTNQMTRRIKMIAGFRQNKRRWSMIGMVVLLALAVVALTNAEAEPMAPAKSAGRPAAKPAPPPRGKGPMQPGASAPKAKPKPAPADTDADTRKKLARRIDRLSFADIDLKDVIQFLREYSGANFYVNWGALQNASVEASTKVSVDVRNITAKRALELILHDISSEDLAYAIDGGVVVVATRLELSQERAWVGKEIPLRAGKAPKEDAALREKLKREIDRLSFADIAFRDVIQFLREYSGANFHVNWRALQAVGIEQSTKISLDVRHVTVKRALELLLRDVSGEVEDGLAYAINGGVLTVSTRADLMRVGPVATADTDWIAAVTAFPPGHTRTLSFLRAGRIAKVSVKGGDTVRAGQELARLDHATELAQLAQIKLEIINSKVSIQAAEVELARKLAHLKRVAALAKTAAASDSERREAEYDVSMAELAVRKAQAEQEKAKQKLRLAEIQVEQMRLLSPINGRVERVFVGVGESVDALGPVVRVVKAGNEPLRIDVPVPLPQAVKIRKGQTAFVRFESTTGGVRGKVVGVSSTADPASRTLSVTVEVANPTGRPAGERVGVSFPGVPKARSAPVGPWFRGPPKLTAPTGPRTGP